MGLTQLHFHQDFKGVDRQTMWDFIRNPHNLAKITPAKMGFQVLTENLPDVMYPGMMIAYRVSPVLGIPLNWVTEITHVKTLEYFVDEQRSGPYAIWHHEHRLIELPDGTLRMEDLLSYQPPLGWIGRIANAWFIKKQVEQIFVHREKVLNEYFNQ